MVWFPLPHCNDSHPRGHRKNPTSTPPHSLPTTPVHNQESPPSGDVPRIPVPSLSSPGHDVVDIAYLTAMFLTCCVPCTLDSSRNPTARCPRSTGGWPGEITAALIPAFAQWASRVSTSGTRTVCVPYPIQALSLKRLFQTYPNGGSTSLPLRRGPGNQLLISSLCSTSNGVRLINKCHPDHPNRSAPQTPGRQS